MSLLKKEADEMLDLYFNWKAAIATKQWDIADKLREEYKEWHCGLGNPETWVPVYESTKHREKRIKGRLKLTMED